jgi:putative endonuclease
LRFKGWTILCQRARTRGGKVDIIARRGRILAFIEVKARADDDHADLALDQYRLRRVAAVAEQLAPRYHRPGDDLRVDAIFMVPGRWPRHLANV